MPATTVERRSFGERLSRMKARVPSSPGLKIEGRLVRMVGLTLEAVGCQLPVGGRCLIRGHDGRLHRAEVVGFSGDRLYLMPTADLHGLGPGATVFPSEEAAEILVGDELLGRILDGEGRPIDNREAIIGHRRSLIGKPINPLHRHPIEEPLDVGVRAINALMAVGRGQRMGLFAGSGVGKSMLLGMMTKFTSADVIVVGLIGERGREVKEFIEHILGEEGLQRAVVVAVPADNPPLLRLQGAQVATTIAEHFRDQGKNVLLLMDSLTRYCQAQREIALAVGEPPATKGYPPSVFAKLPVLVERAGNATKGAGSITAFYTVLTEGDDQQDPIADAARAILDGHIVLSRRLAESGHYPAIDIEASISRAMPQITERQQQLAALAIKQIYGIYQQNRDLISVGAYQAGSDNAIDEAIAMLPSINDFLRQDFDEQVTYEQSLEQLMALIQQEPASLPASTR
ncbi:flagellum-specific ATP synthase [Permianibacter aggregans]|uniref:Flagellum-specific ATP synthase n=2 Tax=Permianibacter aggregans TaxID=1510150 RepID=A0A4R6UY93_9GAMM|nr:flagellum-specific ATP synthase [Permianibacter aggregans]